MNYVEYLDLLNVKKKICIFGLGMFAKGEGYLFLKNMLEPEQQIHYFCDNFASKETVVIDDIKTIGLNYLYEHNNEIVCIVVIQGEARREVEEQLQQHKIKVYTLDYNDIFRLCNQIMQEGDDIFKLRVKNFFKERKYEFQIETSSYCNAKCSFCPNATLKREKSIMSQEVFEKIIEQIKVEDINVSTFILHLNGEPLTDPEIFTRIKRLKVEFPEAKVRFTSNFSLANKEIIEKILESDLDEITCSLNSIDADKYKKIMGLEYERTVSNIEYLIRRKKEKESKLVINLSIVVTEDDKGEVERFKELWKEVNIRVMRLGQWIDKQAPQKMELRTRYGICPIIYRTINILSDGSYALCCFDAEGIINYSIMDTSIEDAWKSKTFSNIRKWHLDKGRTNEECINCSF